MGSRKTEIIAQAYTVQRIKDFFSTCDQIRHFRRIWSHLLRESLMENFIFCTVILQVVGTTIADNIYDIR